jgi:hypothetical protein
VPADFMFLFSISDLDDKLDADGVDGI